MPWKIKEHDTAPEGEDGRYCVHKENADGTPGEIVTCHASMEKARAHQKALYANADDEMGESLVQTVDLTEDYETRPVEFLRVGVFMDAKGREVAIDDAKLDALVASFEGGQAGQDVPIDILHRREEAAGWVRSVYRQGDKLMADVEWNTLGKQLVGDKIYRYLSATIDLARNVLRSISLVNFPAVKGLRPVELGEDGVDAAPPSQLIAEAAGPDTASTTPTSFKEKPSMADEQVVEQVAAATPTPAPASAVLSEHDRAALRRTIEAELRATLLAEFEQIEASKARVMAELMEQVRTERELSEFSHKATSEGRYALPIKRDDLQTMLSDMDKPTRTKVMALLSAITERGTVDFTEHGTSRGGQRRALDTDTLIALRRFVQNGNSVDIFFEANPDLGQKADYDLSEFGG